MNYGEIRTRVYMAIPEQISETISPFEFASALDESFLLIASLAPSHLVPEIVEEMLADRGSTPGAFNQVPLPSRFLMAEWVEFAISRDAQNAPKRKDARVVPAPEFENMLAYSSTDHLATFRNGKMMMSPTPTAAHATGAPAIRLVYKRRMTPYMRSTNNRLNAMIVTLRQSIENPRLLRPWDGVADFCKLTDLGADDDDNYSEGQVEFGLIEGESNPFTLYVLPIIELDRGSTYDNIIIDYDRDVPIGADDGDGFCTYEGCLIWPSQEYDIGRFIADDLEEPELASTWHGVAVNLCAAKLLLTRGQDRAAVTRYDMAYAELGALGVPVPQRPTPRVQDEEGKYA